MLNEVNPHSGTRTGTCLNLWY